MEAGLHSGRSEGAAGNGSPLLRIVGVSKSFPGLKALDRVSLDVHAGEVVAIVGQNGSGKSTLVKVLAGLYEADPGSIVEGSGEGTPPLRFIHQDLGLVDTLDTVENLDLVNQRGGGAFLPFHARPEARAATAAIRRFGADFDVRRPVGELSAAERSIVAIARAMDGWEAAGGVLVLDEPTAALPRSEDEVLFEAIRRVARSGAGVIFISHHLDEVLSIADRVVALRDGRNVADLPVSEVDHDRLIALIAGRRLAEVSSRQVATGAAVALTARGLVADTLAGVDLDLREGEVLGVAGLLGSGRDRLAAAIFGATGTGEGEVRVDGRPLPPGDPGAAIRAGVAYVPADRRRHGAVMTMSVRENLTLPALRPLRRALFGLDTGVERGETRKWIDQVGLQPPRPEQELRLFSGGNQQKVVLAKWLRINPRVLLLDEPTQGIDIGAKAAIYELIAAAAKGGTGVLISSSDPEELTAICDRVMVLREGKVAAVGAGDGLTEEHLIRESLGIGPSSVKTSNSSEVTSWPPSR